MQSINQLRSTVAFTVFVFFALQAQNQYQYQLNQVSTQRKCTVQLSQYQCQLNQVSTQRKCTVPYS